MEFPVKLEVSGFSGKAVLRFPSREEKKGLIERLKASGYDPVGGGVKPDSDPLAFADLITEIVEERLVSIEAEHVETGTKVASKEEIFLYQEGQEVLGFLGRCLLGGIPLGKHKS